MDRFHIWEDGIVNHKERIVKIQNEKVAKQFIADHKSAAPNLKHFLIIVRGVEWQTPAQVRQTFPSADYLGEGRWNFNISDNNYRMAAMVWINRGVFHILKIMSHKDYDKETV